MEIYFRKLELIHECIGRLAEIKKENPTLGKYRKSWKDRDSAERNLQKIIESIIDIGKMIVAERKLREPGNNREVFLVLEDNGLFPSGYMPLIEKMIGMRNILVHSYDRIDDAIVYGVIKNNLAEVKKLSGHFKKIISGMSKRRTK
ncbi:MAG TPA: DUF86 domain-containing protein [Thermodesulfovibrionales bacterium]|nr:DUF86 domain-containing protein [Thermodesulfovibrionales bacterium]